MWKARQLMIIQSHTPQHSCAAIVLIAENSPKLSDASTSRAFHPRSSTEYPQLFQTICAAKKH
jgi:hypothetical protein